MREIKFRAWDNNVKEMIIQDNTDRIDKITHYWETHIKTTIMQYTGLKDAINKNEVYEHDIINLLGIGFLKVEWDYRDTGWICTDKHYKKRNLAHVLLNGGIRVGNIYENPELLEERK